MLGYFFTGKFTAWMIQYIVREKIGFFTLYRGVDKYGKLGKSSENIIKKTS